MAYKFFYIKLKKFADNKNLGKNWFKIILGKKYFDWMKIWSQERLLKNFWQIFFRHRWIFVNKIFGGKVWVKKKLAHTFGVKKWVKKKFRSKEYELKTVKNRFWASKNLASQKLRVQKNVGKNNISVKIFGLKYECLKKEINDNWFRFFKQISNQLVLFKIPKPRQNLQKTIAIITKF